MTAILLHSDSSCFAFPFCGHDWGSRFDSLLDTRPELDGALFSAWVPEMLYEQYEAAMIILDDVRRGARWIQTGYVSE